MAKTHWKVKRRFGMVAGRHTRLNQFRRVQHYSCSMLTPLKYKVKKRASYVQRKSYKRKLLSPVVLKELRHQYRCISGVDSLKLHIKKVNRVNIKGYRMINIQCLESETNMLIKHCISCYKCSGMAEKGRNCLLITHEKKTQGLASVLEVKFLGCGNKHEFATSPKLHTNNSMKYDVNVRAVWGSVVTGNGASHLREMMATMDAPSLSQPAFTKIEQDIGNWWADLCEQEILEAGAEERKVAIERGQYHQGVPCITVIADGGWSKRTHKHTYNALGGVGIIIGKETGKILHLGIRNKYCYICAHYENETQCIPDHVCYKNWNSNSQSMEADIIVDGFLKAESKHGLRYTHLIADGDSSVFAKIKQEVPVWGQDVKKIECANHACKCLRASLEKLVERNPSYKGRHKLTKSVRVRIVSAVRCAIRMRSKDNNKKRGALQLSKDIRNSVHHIFGNHQNCSDFCKASMQKDKIAPNDEDTDNESEHVTDLPVNSICNKSSLYWTEGSSLQQQEEARFGTDLKYFDLTSNMLQDLSIILGRIADKSDRLIFNTTTNLAECWMHIRSKFDGGKVFNLCNRGSWSTRCYGGTLRLNLGPQWSPVVWRKCTGTPAGHNYARLYWEREKQLQSSKKSKCNPKQSALRWKRKMSAIKESTCELGKQSYGKEALQYLPDHNEQQLETLKNQYYEKHIELSSEKIKAIERLTKNQSDSNVWFQERKKRITTSNFGKVIKRRSSIPVVKLVQNLLYSNFTGNTATQIGLKEERVTIQEYILKKADDGVNVTVQSSGLVINTKFNFLGGSPDGIVLENGHKSGIVEVKNVLCNKNINLNQAAKTQKSFCLKIDNNKLSLKRNHNYYYQCQGLLQVCDMPWIDFVLRTINPYQIHIERIFRDDNSWSWWLAKLKAFYFLALLPELAAPRKGFSPGIREPGVWFNDKKPQPVKRRNTFPSLQPSKISGASPKQSTSTGTKNTTTHSVMKLKSTSRQSSRRTKFLGRRISHEWKLSEASNSTKWYSGTVTAVLSGVDGLPNAVYEVLYDEEDEPFEIDNLVEDFQAESIKFIDI